MDLQWVKRCRTAPFSFFMSPWHVRQYVCVDDGSSAYLRWKSAMGLTSRQRGHAFLASAPVGGSCSSHEVGVRCLREQTVIRIDVGLTVRFKDAGMPFLLSHRGLQEQQKHLHSGIHLWLIAKTRRSMHVRPSAGTSVV